MATFLDKQNQVLFCCSCSQLSPLCDLYFCRHCKVARCQDCVFSTVESFSCPHCFEACSVTSELKAKRSRCGHCFRCPQCSSTLTVRSIIQPASESLTTSDDAPVKTLSSLKSPGGTKVYFLSCSHCKWSTRDVDIEDKRSPGDFKEKPSPHQARINELIEFYKEYTVQSIAKRGQVKKPATFRRSRAFGGLLDSSKFKGAVVDEGQISSVANGSHQKISNHSAFDGVATQPADPCPPPVDLYTKAPSLTDMPSTKQTLLNPASQPVTSEDFLPHQLFLVSKKLHRCKGCDHILIKAEMNPGSIRFKIQQIAWHVFPHIRLVKVPELEPGEESEVLLSVSNPVNYPVTISFNECSEQLITNSKEHTTPCVLPTGDFIITPNDDVGNILDDENEIEDDPKFIHSRLSGKLILKFQVLPKAVLENYKIMFEMRFSHKPMIEPEQKEGGSLLSVPVLVKLN